MGIGHAQQPTPAKQYTYFDGLPSDRIEAIGQDSLGLIYLKTDKNSGIESGKFLERGKYKNDVNNRGFTTKDFFMG